MSKLVALWIAASLLVLASPHSRACFYDGQFSNPFNESYPGALDVAIATQKAIKSQAMPQPKQVAGRFGLTMASWWLKTVVTTHPELAKGSYIYLVDRQLWSQVSNDENGITVHVAGPQRDAKGVRVLLLSEATLQNLVSQAITLEQARELGVVVES